MGGTEKGTASERGGLLVSREFKRRPAIGIIASDSNLEPVARTLIEANQNGFFSFVAVFESTDPTIVELCRRLDAGVMELDASEMDDTYDSIKKTGQALGFPGVLYYEPSNRRVDFSRCEAAVEGADRYGVYAPTVEGNDEELSVVAAIPAYNEESTIGEVVNGVLEHVGEVLIVDDGSIDDTVAVAEQAGGTVVKHDRNRGYGAALKTAFTEAKRRDVDVLVTLDGDGQHDSEEIPKLLRKYRTTDANVIIGSRFRDDTELHVPLYRRVGLWIINVFTNLSLGATRMRSWVSDTQSGFRVYNKQAIQSLANDNRIGNGMSASTDILYHTHEQGYQIEEIGTPIRYDGDGTSSQNPVIHGFAVIGNILKTVERERPLTFLGVPGLTAVLIGIGFGYWTMFNYFQNGAFSAGIALLCVLFVFLGSLLSLASVILHSLNTHIETLAEQRLRREK